MRHKQVSQRFGRRSGHRDAMFKNLCISVIEHEQIKTTLKKAKFLRKVLEPLVNLSKVDSVANRRLAFSRLGNKSAVGRLFAQIGPKVLNRPGGYLRILKCDTRKGDATPMAYVRFSDEIGSV